LAQNNENIKITSIGVPLRYAPPEKSTEKSTTAQNGLIKKEISYLNDYLDAEKYMQDHQNKVSYIRIETERMDLFSDYSVDRNNLKFAIACGDKATTRTNGQQLLA